MAGSDSGRALAGAPRATQARRSQSRQHGGGHMQNRPEAIAYAVAALAIVAIVALVAPRAEAMCCVCEGTGCGPGFCVDNIADGNACSQLCQGCGTVVFAANDTCTGGCSVAPDLPTATPSNTPTQTGTPSQTPTHTPSA